MTDYDKLNELIVNGKKKQYEIIGKEFKGLAPSTLKVSNTNVNKMFRELNVKTDILKLDWINNFKLMIKSYLNKMNPNTRKNYLSVIISLLYNDYDKNKNLIDDFVKESKLNFTEINLHTKSDKKCDDDRILTLTEYDDFIKKLSKNPITQMEYVMFMILRFIPMRNELATIKYIKNKEYEKLNNDEKNSTNWLLEKSRSLEIIRNKYKTANYHGKIITPIKQPLKSIIVKYIKDNEIESNNYLFINKSKTGLGEVLSENALTQKLAYISKGILGKPITTSSIFKILCCDAVKDFGDNKLINNEIIKMLTEYATNRGTSVKQIIQYYIYGNKIGDNLSEASDE